MFQIQNVKLNGSSITTSLNQKGVELADDTDLTNQNSLTEPLPVDNDPSHSYNNFGAVTQTLSKELEDLERKNFASSVVKIHYVNGNYHSNSDSYELKWCDSETSLKSNECDRRYYETKQWHSNLFFYKRSKAAIDLNHRVQLKFLPLKPFTMVPCTADGSR